MIQRYFIDIVYYNNQVFCVCMCHKELHYELLGRVCDGCLGFNGREPGSQLLSKNKKCEVARKIYTVEKTVKAY